ncbi:CHASE2 domain-containing protein [Synechococcus sp. UW140]|uniref:CHASE2 domain-containing protein n=1 Tax=Synechococcus sp. UW140 TaxID=368503 RepID=UPI003137A6CF
MANINLVIRKGANNPSGLQVFITAPGCNNAFAVPEPKQLYELQKAWGHRFLKHHDPAFVWPQGAAVVKTYSNQLRLALQQWIESPDWQPLQQLLVALPNLPLTLRLEQVKADLCSLPWESLCLQRPIWRVDGNGLSKIKQVTLQARKPRVLLVVGAEQGLNLDEEINQLMQLQRSGRIQLTMLRAEHCNADALRKALTESSGWNAALYLGHSNSGPMGGVLHLGDGSQINGQSLESHLAIAAKNGLRLLLFNSCSGLQLASVAARAGINWSICFLELVPSKAAASAFAELLSGLEAGADLVKALVKTRAILASNEYFEGCDLLLATVATSDAEEFKLPLRRRRQLVLRLASSSKKQAIAAVAFSAVAFLMELTPSNPVNTYLLDRRLDVQRTWRQLVKQPGPHVDISNKPIPVLLLDQATFQSLGVPAVADHTSRYALAEVLKRTPPDQVPLVGLDVLIDQPRSGTNQLAEVIQKQPERLVVAGYLSPYSDPSQGAVGNMWFQSSILNKVGMKSADLAVGTAARDGSRKPVPLQTQYSISKDNFAGALSNHPQRVLPSDRIIDWSLNWANWIHLVQPVDLATLKSKLLLVGTDGYLGNNEADLFNAPSSLQGVFLRGDQPILIRNKSVVPGVLVQAVLIQSLNLNHWLTPVSQTLCTAAAAALGVLLAALFEKRRDRLVAIFLIALISCPLAFGLAIWQLWLVPLLLPLLALTTTTVSRND